MVLIQRAVQNKHTRALHGARQEARHIWETSVSRGTGKQVGQPQESGRPLRCTRPCSLPHSWERARTHGAVSGPGNIPAHSGPRHGSRKRTSLLSASASPLPLLLLLDVIIFMTRRSEHASRVFSSHLLSTFPRRSGMGGREQPGADGRGDPAVLLCPAQGQRPGQVLQLLWILVSSSE